MYDITIPCNELEDAILAERNNLIYQIIQKINVDLASDYKIRDAYFAVYSTLEIKKRLYYRYNRRSCRRNMYAFLICWMETCLL
jgi:hypothetical protein